jgi:hypothetical protein
MTVKPHWTHSTLTFVLTMSEYRSTADCNAFFLTEQTSSRERISSVIVATNVAMLSYV